MAKVLDDGLMLTLGVVGVVAAAGAVVSRRGSRSKYREGHEAPHGSAYVVVNLMSHGKKRIHGPFSSAEQAEAWGKAHGEDVSVKTVNLVSKGMDGDFMVIEQHSDGEVFHGFFKTASTASRWINRQPDEQTLTDSFVVRVHRAGSAAMHRGSRAYREGYQSPAGIAYIVENRLAVGNDRLHGPFSSKREALAWASKHGNDPAVHMVNMVSNDAGRFVINELHEEMDGTPFIVYRGFFKTESDATDWADRQPGEETMQEMFTEVVNKPRA